LLNAGGENVKLHLLHTNDVHSQLENFMRLGRELRALRDGLRNRGEFVLTFDIGDVLDRVRPETEATMGLINADLLASLEYDGFVFGNNEGLTIPVHHWQTFQQRANTVIFGTNFRELDGSAFSFFEDYHIYRQGEVNVGVFGLTPDYRRPYERLGVKVLDPIERAKTMVKRLRKKGCQLIVLLSHLGHYQDRVLARKVQGIDVILGGHTHQFMKQAEKIGQTAMFQAGKHAWAFGYTVIDFDIDSATVTNVVSTSRAVRHETPFDDKMRRAYENSKSAVKERLSTPVIHLTEPLEVDFEAESPFANALVDALFESYPADVGMMMTGALNASLLPGRIELQHILGACSTPTRPVLLTLSGKDLISIVEKAIRPEFFRRPGFGYGFRGSVVGYLALANATAYVETGENGDGEVRLSKLLIGGKPVDPEANYRVVTCEFLWLSPTFEEFQRATDIDYQPPLVREVLLDQLGSPNRLADARKRRYVIRDRTSSRHT
jgi:2',3'-cyclic-nucleotide 2'-phosphodiesterase (5'-nucleotidase family)